MRARKSDETLKSLINDRTLKTSCGCWVWLYGTKEPATDCGFQNTYGLVWDGHKVVTTHRLSFELFNGPIPVGSLVCHTCDVPECCNPAHLFVGTRKSNTYDMIDKGRDNRGAPKRGEASHLAKLTQSQVTELRRRYAAGEASQRLLGIDYGISQSAVFKIVRRQRWRDV